MPQPLAETRHNEDNKPLQERDGHERYLTDGGNLFRIVTPFAISEADAHVFMSLENCMTLEVQSYSPQQLYGMRLRPVRAASSGERRAVRPERHAVRPER